MRRSGDNVWRPSFGNRAVALLVGLAWLAGTTWLAQSGPASPKEMIEAAVGDLFVLIALPIALFRWRMVLEYDELVCVFIRVRRLNLREIVDAKCVAKQGLVFVCKDGSEHSFGAVGNGRWGAPAS
ncbi:MAG: hypothetical protein ACXVXO_12570 [Mycobacteriaceae bacterium]